MAKSHLNILDQEVQDQVVKYVKQHNPIARLLHKTGDEDPYVITPDQTQNVPTHLLILRYMHNAIYFSTKYRENAINSI